MTASLDDELVCEMVEAVSGKTNPLGLVLWGGSPDVLNKYVDRRHSPEGEEWTI